MEGEETQPQIPFPFEDDSPSRVRETFKQALNTHPSLEQALHRHFEEPNVSVDAHSRRRRLRLGEDVLSKVRIYLDQRYWIYCRDAMLGNPAEPIHGDIFELLCGLVDCGRVVCPVSYPVLSETLKQGDKLRRASTARCIDRLCTGVAIQPFDTLIEAELLHFFMTRSNPDGKFYPLKQMVWNFSSWVLGEMIPRSTFFDASTSHALAKGLYDIMAVVPFKHVVEAFSDEPPVSPSEDQAWADEVNAGSAQHRHEVTSFNTVFMSEVAGALDATDAVFRRVSREMYRNATGHDAPPIESADVQEGARQSRNLIYHAFVRGKISTELPFCHIGAGVHAAIRFRQQLYKRGDIWDLKHAHSALGYCDAFFTERNLGNLLCQSPLRYDQKYGCNILWEDAKILTYLCSLRDGTAASRERG